MQFKSKLGNLCRQSYIISNPENRYAQGSHGRDMYSTQLFYDGNVAQPHNLNNVNIMNYKQLCCNLCHRHK